MLNDNISIDGSTKNISNNKINIDGLDESDIEEINIFKGIDNGYGHDGEQVAECTEIVFTGKTEDFMNIVDDEDLSIEEKLNKVANLIK